MYEAVTQAAVAPVPYISTRYNELLETCVTRSKQTTEIASTRYKTGAPSSAMSPAVARVKLIGPAISRSCSAGPFGSAPGRPPFVRYCGVPHHAPQPRAPHEPALSFEKRSEGFTPSLEGRPPDRTGHVPDRAHFLIGTPKRLKSAATQTKQTSEVISNRYKIRGSCRAERERRFLVRSASDRSRNDIRNEESAACGMREWPHLNLRRRLG
jgi:hypothetical protein